MKTTHLYFIHHSCYLWEGEEMFLLFDYAGAGDPHSLIAHAPNKPLYLLNTHSHHDHYTPQIFKEFTEHPAGGHYLFHQELKSVVCEKEEITFLATGASYTTHNLYVKAYGSTDIGGSFYCEAEGQRIFHSGDLNNWHWNEEADQYHIDLYEAAWHRVLKRLTSDIQELDLLMFPTDLRLGKDYLKGLEELLAQVRVKYLAPMHINGKLQSSALQALAKAHHIELLIPTPNVARPITTQTTKES